MSTYKIEHEVFDHGIRGTDYFPSQGTAFTDYDYVVTGAGETFNEALEDALEGMTRLISNPTLESPNWVTEELDLIYAEEELSNKENNTLSAVRWHADEISMQVSSRNYRDYGCGHTPGDYCWSCYSQTVQDLIDEAEDYPYYYVSILWRVVEVEEVEADVA